MIATDYNAVICIDGSTGTVQRFSGSSDYALGGTGSAFGTATGYYKVKVSEDKNSIVLDETGTGNFFLFLFFKVEGILKKNYIFLLVISFFFFLV